SPIEDNNTSGESAYGLAHSCRMFQSGFCRECALARAGGDETPDRYSAATPRVRARGARTSEQDSGDLCSRSGGRKGFTGSERVDDGGGGAGEDVGEVGAGVCVCGCADGHAVAAGWVGGTGEQEFSERDWRNECDACCAKGEQRYPKRR